MIFKSKTPPDVSPENAGEKKKEEGQAPGKARFSVRWASGDNKFEWSDTNLPDLDEVELNLLKNARISPHAARVVKQMRNEGLPLKQIVFNLRSRKGFSASTVQKIHAILAKAKKQKNEIEFRNS